MSFSEELNGLMDCPTPLVRRFMALLEPVDDARLEAMAQESRRLTRLHFGRTIRLFAPDRPSRGGTIGRVSGNL